MLPLEDFMNLKGYKTSLRNECFLSLKTLIELGPALVYIDNNLLLSNSKEQIFQLIEQFHVLSTKQKLKLAPEKSNFMLLKVKYLGNEIGFNTIEPRLSKVAAIHKLSPPLGKVVLMSFLNVYTKIIETLPINLKPFNDLIHDNSPGLWTTDHETLFQKIKNALTSDTELTIPNTKHPFFITVDASLIGLGAVLFQFDLNNKMKVISYNSRVPNPQEQKLFYNRL